MEIPIPGPLLAELREDLAEIQTLQAHFSQRSNTIGQALGIVGPFGIDVYAGVIRVLGTPEGPPAESPGKDT